MQVNDFIENSFSYFKQRSVDVDRLCMWVLGRSWFSWNFLKNTCEQTCNFFWEKRFMLFLSLSEETTMREKRILIKNSEFTFVLTSTYPYHMSWDIYFINVYMEGIRGKETLGEGKTSKKKSTRSSWVAYGSHLLTYFLFIWLLSFILHRKSVISAPREFLLVLNADLCLSLEWISMNFSLSSFSLSKPYHLARASSHPLSSTESSLIARCRTLCPFLASTVLFCFH
jgi:hypothetical protein